jgi:hypothetical protein
LPSAWDGRDREAKIFLESVLLLNTSSRTAGADLDSGHKIEPPQKKVVIASGLLPFLNHEEGIGGRRESHDPRLAIARAAASDARAPRERFTRRSEAQIEP